MRVFLIIIFLIGTHVSFAQEKTNSVKKDFQIFRKALTKTHPALYRFTPEERFNTVLDSIESQLTDASTELQLFQALSKIISLIREGHSYVDPSDKLSKQAKDKKLFPFSVILNENRLVVRKSRSSSYAEFEGTEIISINGQSISSIVNSLASSTGMKSAFNNSAMESTFSEYNNFSFAYYYHVDTTSTFNLEYKVLRSQEIRKAKVHGTKQGLKGKDYPRMPEERNPPMDLQIDDENGIAIMRISTFAYWVVSKKIEDYITFFEESFEKLKGAKVKNLIIDIRNNGGGEEIIGAELLTYLIDKDFKIYKFGKAKTLDFSDTNKLPRSYKLKPSRKHYTETDSGYILKKGDFLKVFKPKLLNRFKGETYVLSNNRCWSAANTFLALVKTYDLATIIGQESGGSYEDVDGRLRVSFTLPYSKIKVGYPAWSFRIDSEGGNRLKGVVPDYIIKRNIEELLTNKDVELELAYKLIKDDLPSDAKRP